MIATYIHWDVNPEIFNLFGISLRYYGILFVGGLLLSIYVLGVMFKNENLPAANLEKIVMYSLVGIFVGARLGHCLFYEPGYYLSHPLEIFIPIQPTPDGGYRFSGFQGLASHGGGLGLILALVLYTRKTKDSLIRTVDLVAIATPLTGFFIRLANLMNSEINGVQTDVPWAFVFVRVDNLPRHPAQLYEAIAYLFIFLISYLVYRYRKVMIGTGFFFGLTITSIFIARFFIEFIKEKQVDFEQQMTLDMGQLLSIPYLLVGIGFVVYGLKQNRKLSAE